MKHALGDQFESSILETTEASAMVVEEVIQELWSGYGQILRLSLTGCSRSTVVVKHVTMPTAQRHPRGWNSDLSHERKVFSYQVESEWYSSWSSRCDSHCRVPEFLTFARHDERVLLVLEDLDAAGFSQRLTSIREAQIEQCLGWLAEFHATFMGEQPKSLWDTGTYWHLETRPDELEAMDDPRLKAAAAKIDRKLNQARFQTFVHGDAKLANFCFPDSGTQVAAVDFQYVGGGCGMKDVAYFISSCLDEAECDRQEAALLDCYFNALKRALERRGADWDAAAIEAEWRGLYPVAWADFHRFLKGWCPSHWKINSYSERVAREVIAALA